MQVQRPPVQHIPGQQIPDTAAKAEATSKQPETATQSDNLEFDVLSLNTYALPKPLGKAIEERSTRIGQSLQPYEIMGFQETFSADSRYLAKAAGSAGLKHAVYQPSARRLLTSGLSTFSNYQIVEQDFKPFKYASHADALAQKGVSFTRLELPGGEKVDVYNTHFQAARDKADQAHEKLALKVMAQLFAGYDMPRDQIRAHDAEVLKEMVDQHDQGYPVIIMGDFNTHESHPLYAQLKASLGVNDSFREFNPSDPGYTSDGKTNPYKSNPDNRKRVDYIFYRSGQNTALEVVDSKLAFDQAVDGMFVSDHYGVQTRFRLNKK